MSRGRSFGGCNTCRSRHVKCDETHPKCIKCEKLGLPCGGYEKNIFFDSASALEGETVRFRRPLSTEAERLRMSEWLTSTVPPKLAYHYLEEIDEQCEKVHSSQDICIDRGPFGVFRLTQPSPQHRHSLDLDSSSDAQDLTQDLGLLFYDDTFADESERQASPTTLALTNIGFGSLETTRSAARSYTFLPDPSRIIEIFDDESMDRISGFSLHTQASNTATCHIMGYPSNVQSNPLASIMPASSNVPANAVFLLSHYSTTVIRLLTPFRHTKTPWHILFIPHVKNCLAALAMGEKLEHASLCIFFGTLALSAFSMHGVSHHESWLDESRTYKEQASQHVAMMLSTAYKIPKTAKYKCILMALITMVQLSSFSGNRHETEYYFLEAEKFIRLRGLHRRKSRKVRLLHHCYVFERLFFESTSVAKTNSDQRTHVMKAVESSGILVYGQDSASFRLPNFHDLDREMQRAKDQEEGENDLHLERIGDFPGTLYPEVFGVPELYMLLLSLIIRLGKEKDQVDGPDMSRNSSPKDFMAQAKAIERSILRMHPAQYPSFISYNIKQYDNKEVIENMLLAIYHALAIYFYRRVYDLDSSLLQQRVVAVRDSLLLCEKADPDAVCGSAGFVWPAFIAACEAEDAEVRDSFSDMFTKVAQKSGLSTFADTLSDIRQVWSDKKNINVTWLDVMSKKSQ